LGLASIKRDEAAVLLLERLRLGSEDEKKKCAMALGVLDLPHTRRALAAALRDPRAALAAAAALLPPSP
jgi:hypothetical protein